MSSMASEEGASLLEDTLMMSLLYLVASACDASNVRFDQNYGARVEFEVQDKMQANTTCASHPYLDAVVHLSWDSMWLTWQHKNHNYVWSGDEKALVKNSTPPVMSSFDSATRKLLRAELRGRWARWQKLKLGMKDMLRSIVTDLLILVRSGYTIHDVRQVWYGISHSRFHQDLIQTCW